MTLSVCLQVSTTLYLRSYQCSTESQLFQTLFASMIIDTGRLLQKLLLVHTTMSYYGQVLDYRDFPA